MADEVKFPVEATHIMMFARSVADDNPIYYDEEYAKKTEVGHIIAPPTFPRAVAQFDPDYFLRPKVGQKWFGSGKNATGLTEPAKSSGGLHAEQHFEYHRQEYRDQNGELVVTSRGVGVKTERPVEQK